VVVAALGNDDVGPALARFDELQVHGAHGSVVLVADRLERAPALFEVAPDAPHQANVRVGIDEDLDVVQVANVGRYQRHDALHDDHRGWRDAVRRIAAQVAVEIVQGRLDGAAGAKCAQVLEQKLGFEGVGVVVVDAGAFLGR